MEQGQTGTPVQDPTVSTLEHARHALANHDIAGARRLVAQAMAENHG